MKMVRSILLLALLSGAAFGQSSAASATANVGQQATFTVTNDGTPPFTYQWLKNGTPVAASPTITGATSATMVIKPVAAADAGSYTVTVSNSAGSVTSSAATLTVISKPTTATAGVMVQ